MTRLTAAEIRDALTILVESATTDHAQLHAVYGARHHRTRDAYLAVLTLTCALHAMDTAVKLRNERAGGAA